MFSTFAKMLSTFLYILCLWYAHAHQHTKPDILCDLMDIKNIKYNFQCGDVFCEGPIQYCSDDNVCLYCSKNVCQTQTPPGQCQLQCKSLQFGNIREQCDELIKQKKNSTRDYENDMQGFCVDVYYLSAICAVLVVFSTMIIFTTSHLFKRYLNRKNPSFVNIKQIFKCCCFSYPETRNQNATCTSEEMTSICVPSGK